MPSKRKSNGNGRRTSRPTGRGNDGRRHDAIALLKADHRQVEGWFEQFKKSRVQGEEGRARRIDLSGPEDPYADRGGDFLPRISRSSRR